MSDVLTAPSAGSLVLFDFVTAPDGTPSVYVGRSKVGFGVDGSYADVTPAVGLPVNLLAIPALADFTNSALTLDATLTTSALVVTPNGYAGGAFDVGAPAGGAVVVFEQLATATSTVWDVLNVIPLGGGAMVTSTAAAGRFEFISAGAFQMRTRVGTVGTGTIAVRVQLTSGQKIMRIFNTSRFNLSANASLQLAGADVTTANPVPTVTPGAPNFTPAQVSVTTTATLIVAARAGRQSAVIINGGTTPLYLGNAGVTTTTGVPLPGILGASVTIATTAAIYGITASGTAAIGEYELY